MSLIRCEWLKQYCGICICSPFEYEPIVLSSFLSKHLHIVEVLVIIAKSRMNIYLRVYLWIFSFLFLLEKYQDWK